MNNEEEEVLDVVLSPQKKVPHAITCPMTLLNADLNPSWRTPAVSTPPTLLGFIDTDSQFRVTKRYVIQHPIVSLISSHPRGLCTLVPEEKQRRKNLPLR